MKFLTISFVPLRHLEFSHTRKFEPIVDILCGEVAIISLVSSDIN